MLKKLLIIGLAVALICLLRRATARNMAIMIISASLGATLVMKWPDSRPVRTPASEPGSPLDPSGKQVDPGSGGSRPAGIAKILEDAGESAKLGSAAIGFCLLDGIGNEVINFHSGQSFIPASTMKTVTSATALELLGPEFRFSTQLMANAPMVDGRIDGDVVIRGGGDPALGLADLESWVDKLKAKGVREITGGIVGDAGFFADPIFDDFWNWGDIGNGYGSPVAGLNLNHNRFLARFRPGSAVGDDAKFLGALPDVPGVEWVNLVKSGAEGSGDGVMIYGGANTRRIELRGTVPLGPPVFEVSGAVPDPPLFAAFHLTRLLRASGIVVSKAAVTGARPDADREMIAHKSPPLIEIIRHLHDVSDNHETECIFRMIGKHAGLPPDAAVRKHWKSRDLDFTNLRMEDGSGLARANFIRPFDLARLQHLAGSGPHGNLYRESLLSRSDGAFRWKGGAMSGVRAYTGFARHRSGREFTFALMVNHYSDSVAVSELREAIIAEMLEGAILDPDQ